MGSTPVAGQQLSPRFARAFYTCPLFLAGFSIVMMSCPGHDYHLTCFPGLDRPKAINSARSLLSLVSSSFSSHGRRPAMASTTQELHDKFEPKPNPQQLTGPDDQ